MDLEWLRRHCLSFPHATEHLQWESLVFKAGGKLFAIAALEPARVWLSFRSTPEECAELIEIPGVIPAPYLARAHWVALETEDALSRNELKQRLRRSYDLILAGLPRKTREALAASSSRKRTLQPAVRADRRNPE